MIHAYSWPTPNGKKLHIMLEECGLDYEVHPIAIGKGEQFGEEFSKISPNNKIPAIVDEDGPGGKPFSLFESGAILMYLARKTAKFLPDPADDPTGFFRVMEWLMWQMGGVGPMLGQTGHFVIFAKEKVDYGIERYTKEAMRLYGVANKRLADHKFLAGEDFTIADIACFPWMANYPRYKLNLDDMPHVLRWMEEIEARPGVKRGLKVLAPQ
ncbi:MAG: glutathione binding-like protein [Alphaproteobacteria bacterium]|nr:glutathione binding-like protein [Alphaproteobacteria bacterium]